MGRSLGTTLGLFHAGTLFLCTAGLAGVGTAYFDKILTTQALTRTRTTAKQSAGQISAELRDIAHKTELNLESSEDSPDPKVFASDDRIISVRYYKRAPRHSEDARPDWSWVRPATGPQTALLDVRYPIEWGTLPKEGRARFGRLGKDKPVLRLTYPLRKNAAFVLDVDPTRLSLADTSEDGPRFILLDSSDRVVHQHHDSRYSSGEQLLAPSVPTGETATEYRDVPDGPLLYGSRVDAGFGASVISQFPRRLVQDQLSPFMAFSFAWIGLFGTMGILFIWRYVRENLSTRARNLEEAVRSALKSPLPVLIREQDGTDEISRLAKAFQDVLDRFRYRQRVHATLGKFSPGGRSSQLPPHLPENVWVNATYLHVSFAGLADSIEAGRNATDTSLVLNDLLQTAQEILERSGGVLNQVTGPSFTAFWGVPSPVDDGVDRAILFCQAIEEKLKWLNRDREVKGASQIRSHSGLHHGPAFAGEIGPDQRLEFTLLGEAPGLANELHAFARANGHRTVISTKGLEESHRRNEVEPVMDENRWAGKAFILKQSLPETQPIQLESPPGAVDLGPTSDTPAEIKAA